jgi:hypothetical protein
MRAAPYWPWKDAVLQRQVHAGRIHQIDDGQPVAHRDLLNARRILVIVSGHHAPAFTVASLATITAGRPSIFANPVTTPAPGA